jgi:hypothetical protein
MVVDLVIQFLTFYYGHHVAKLIATSVGKPESDPVEYIFYSPLLFLVTVISTVIVKYNQRYIKYRTKKGIF